MRTKYFKLHDVRWRVVKIVSDVYFILFTEVALLLKNYVAAAEETLPFITNISLQNISTVPEIVLRVDSRYPLTGLVNTILCVMLS